MGIKYNENEKTSIITGVNTLTLKQAIKRKFGGITVFDKFIKLQDNKLFIHKFFLPELYFILEQIEDNSGLKEVLLRDSWLVSVNKDYPQISTALINNKIQLKSHQRDFITKYYSKKNKYNFNGYLLGFEQGLGKTYTSLALMYLLKKKHVIIVCPKATIESVWIPSINFLFPNINVCTYKKQFDNSCNFYITSYQSLNKFPEIRVDNCGIIIDESQNLRNFDSKSVNDLFRLVRITQSNDIIVCSGTPIKAYVKEFFPVLKILDPYFDIEAKETLENIAKINSNLCDEIIRNRFSLTIHRKTKETVLKLPSKIYEDILITIPNRDKYTLDNIKVLSNEFWNDRRKHYKENYSKYENEYYTALLSINDKLDKNDYKLYKERIKQISKLGGSNTNNIDIVRWCRDYENNTIIPLLSSENKKKFRNARTVIKYVELKIEGEWLGGFLNRMRSEMFSQMVKHSPINQLITNASKKTICFTTYVQVAETAYDYIKLNKKFNPVLITGKTNITENITKFKNENNPLIATIQSLSTGQTLTEANTVIFLNPPWRHVDKVQAEDRVHRIGQESDVFIYTFVLDTAPEDNLSTRMEDVVLWSKERFEKIMGFESNIFSKLLDRYIS